MNPHGNLVEEESIPRADKCYLGDGLYAIFLNGGFYLQAYNGIEVTQSVWLEDLSALVFFAHSKGLVV